MIIHLPILEGIIEMTKFKFIWLNLLVKTLMNITGLCMRGSNRE